MNPITENSVPLRLMERLEKYGYVSAGLSFLVLGMIIFAYGWVQFALTFEQGPPQAVLVMMNELLLVVILLELFRTVINFLKSHIISLEPFLHVGIIAAIRRLLTIGAEMSIHMEITPERFSQYMIDAGVSVTVTLALIVALYLQRLRTGSGAET